MSKMLKQGAKVLYKGEVEIIHSSSKNFVNKQITYAIQGKESKEVKEKGISIEKFTLIGGKVRTKTPLKKDDGPIVALRSKYKELYGKNVSNNKKNKIDWIQAKIDAKLPKDDSKEVPEKTSEPSSYQVLAALTPVELRNLISEKKLDIDPADFKTDEELLIAVCEELEIEIPE